MSAGVKSTLNILGYTHEGIGFDRTVVPVQPTSGIASLGRPSTSSTNHAQPFQSNAALEFGKIRESGRSKDYGLNCLDYLEMDAPTSQSLNAVEMAIHSSLAPSVEAVLTVPNEPERTIVAIDISSLEHRNTSSLAPVDGGFAAWSFLFCAFLVETIVWGFPNAFGSFLDAYLKDPTYSTQRHASSLLPLVGTLASGIMYCSGPFTYPITYRYPRYTRASMWVGAAICWVSLFAASYTTKVTNLVLFQGVLYAFGGAMLYNPCLSYVSEWFVVRRGLAIGVISAGTATGGLLLPLILPRLIDKYGPSVTLRIVSVVFMVLLLPALPFLKGRLPHARVQGPSARSNGSEKEWMRSRNWIILVTVSTLQGFGYFVPVVWLPTFASELHLSSSNSSLSLAILNGTSVVGRVVFGILADALNPWLLAVSTLFSTCVATFVLWGILGSSFAGVMGFGLVYGALAGGWPSLWTGFTVEFAKEDPRLSTTLIGYLMLSRGLGNILSTPISTALARTHGHDLGSVRKRLGFEVGGGKFENVIIYAGTCFAAAAIIAGIGWALDTRRARRYN